MTGQISIFDYMTSRFDPLAVYVRTELCQKERDYIKRILARANTKKEKTEAIKHYFGRTMFSFSAPRFDESKPHLHSGQAWSNRLVLYWQKPFENVDTEQTYTYTQLTNEITDAIAKGEYQ